MKIRNPNPRQIPAGPSSANTFPSGGRVEYWFIFETTESAGCETRVQKIPAMYPPKKDTPSCSSLEHSDRGLGTTFLYKSSTVLSKLQNY
jgi:hypothetical protein